WQSSRDASGGSDALGGGHAHCGAMIYLGDNWPDEYRASLLTRHFHGRRMNVERLDRQGSGYVGKHEPDICFSADPFFRGIDLTYGPDGGVFILDWSDTGECHESTGIHRTSGRIYKITYGDPPKPSVVDLTKLKSHELAELHEHPNEWYARMARREILDRLNQDPRPDPREIFSSLDRADSSLTADSIERLTRYRLPHFPLSVRIRAFQTALAVGTIFPRDLAEKYISDSTPDIRAVASQLALSYEPLDVLAGKRDPSLYHFPERLLDVFNRQAQQETDSRARLHLASNLARIIPEKRVRAIQALSSREEDANDHNIPLMLWYAINPIADTQPAHLATILESCKIPTLRRLIVRRLASAIDNDPKSLTDAIRLSADKDIKFQSDVIDGLTLAFT